MTVERRTMGEILAEIQQRFNQIRSCQIETRWYSCAGPTPAQSGGVEILKRCVYCGIHKTIQRFRGEILGLPRTDHQAEIGWIPPPPDVCDDCARTRELQDPFKRV